MEDILTKRSGVVAAAGNTISFAAPAVCRARLILTSALCGEAKSIGQLRSVNFGASVSCYMGCGLLQYVDEVDLSLR